MATSSDNQRPASGQPTTTLVSARVWEVFSPPPINSIKGVLIPRSLNKQRKRRKIAVEVYRHNSNKDRAKGLGSSLRASLSARRASSSSSYEECVVRILVAKNQDVHKEAKRRARARRKAHDQTNASLDLNEGQLASHMLLAAGGDGGSDSSSDSDDEEDQDDDASVSTNLVPLQFRDSDHGRAKADYEKGWHAKYRLPITALEIRGTHRTGVIVHVTLGKIQHTREIIFDNHEEAEDFENVIRSELAKEDQRREAKLQSVLGGKKLPPGEKVTFLVEIVSAWDILAGDLFSSDPYVTCLFNGREVHRTKYIPKTLEPVWTLKTGSLFLLEVSSRELFLSDGLLCVLRDFDKIGSNETLGAVTIPPKTLYDAKGERMVFDFEPSPGETKAVTGSMAIRCRRASQYDIDFLKDYQSDSDELGVKANHKNVLAIKGGASNIRSIVTTNERHFWEGGERVKKYKVRPEPDPKRPEETKWMTAGEVEKECTKESHNWIDTGSGKLGRLFVEILKCEDLPNLDTGGFAGNKTDAFVSLVFEDTFVTTDVIDDSLSPRWLPWTKRAFIFHIFHSSSQLFLGVFDHDEGINPADDHDLVGRVSVDFSNLRKDTVYNLKYNIYDTALRSDRSRRGTITIRLRLDIDDDRRVLCSNLEPPPQMYVNVKKRRAHRVVRYTCTGLYDMEKYNMKTINSYIEELLQLQHIGFYLQDGVLALLLWRGTLPVKLFGREIMLPVHSASAFVLAVFLVERPQLIPSFCFASIAWILLATMDYRRHLPDVWSRCKSYGELVQVLVFGESTVRPQTIEPFENNDAAQAFIQDFEKRIVESETEAKRAYEESLRAQEEYEREMEEIGEAPVDLAKKNGGGVSIDPFKPILYPVQQNLAMLCRYVRHMKYIVSWEECYISFWVASGCLLLSVICLFIPWLFLLQWGSRILVWTLFGPWMKLVDIFYVSKLKPETEEERFERTRLEREKRRLLTSKAISEARIKREDAAKLTAMKKHLFGKYITRVPVLKEDRYRDMPLPDSSANPYRPEPLLLSELAMQEAGYHRTRLPGQHLVGDMIPKIEKEVFTEAPIGQAIAHARQLDKEGPGGGAKLVPDSTMEAYTKIGMLLFSAGVMTWFGVPLLSNVVQAVLRWLND